MEQNSIGLIVMDMDGTLLNEHGIITSATRDALLAARAKGVHLAICSGRNCDNISNMMLSAGLDDCHVLSLNGGYCLEKPYGSVVADHRLAAPIARQITEILDASGLAYAAFQARIVLEPNERRLRDDSYWGFPAQCGRAALLEALPQGINKFVVIEEKCPALLDQLRERLTGIDGLCVTSSWVNNVELMPVGCSKGTAVQELADQLGLPLERVMALGDQDNDIEMLKVAGLGVAMGNASENARRAAKATTDTNGRDGVAQAIRRYVLEGSL